VHCVLLLVSSVVRSFVLRVSFTLLCFVFRYFVRLRCCSLFIDALICVLSQVVRKVCLPFFICLFRSFVIVLVRTFVIYIVLSFFLPPFLSLCVYSFIYLCIWFGVLYFFICLCRSFVLPFFHYFVRSFILHICLDYCVFVMSTLSFFLY